MYAGRRDGRRRRKTTSVPRPSVQHQRPTCAPPASVPRPTSVPPRCRPTSVAPASHQCRTSVSPPSHQCRTVVPPRPTSVPLASDIVAHSCSTCLPFLSQPASHQRPASVPPHTDSVPPTSPQRPTLVPHLCHTRLPPTHHQRPTTSSTHQCRTSVHNCTTTIPPRRRPTCQCRTVVPPRPTSVPPTSHHVLDSPMSHRRPTTSHQCPTSTQLVCHFCHTNPLISSGRPTYAAAVVEHAAAPRWGGSASAAFGRRLLFLSVRCCLRALAVSQGLLPSRPCRVAGPSRVWPPSA